MDAKIIGIIAIAALVAIGGAAFALAGPSSDNDDSVSGGSAESRTTDTTIDTGEETITDITPETQSGEYPFTIVSESGTCECEITETSEGYTITFSEINEEGTTYSISGTLNGNIVIEAGDYDFELVLNGITITTSSEVPIYIGSGEDVTITAKKNTVNTIYDNRSEVSDDDISASVYSACDLKIKGNGKLVIVSTNNNGIHSKDDLSVKNLTLYVTAVDNCLKGNDSVTITSGNITLNATSGDAIKTTSTDLSSSGKQRGTVTINSDDGDTALTIKSY